PAAKKVFDYIKEGTRGHGHQNPHLVLQGFARTRSWSREVDLAGLFVHGYPHLVAGVHAAKRGSRPKVEGFAP
ncbi:MAG TPA: hypothetical protein VML01_09240, partial [Bryobacterales bacterium]|nr:hypothetical protein [Bryobacterales bacterium]